MSDLRDKNQPQSSFEPPITAEDVLVMLLSNLDNAKTKLERHARKAENSEDAQHYRQDLDSADDIMKFKSIVSESMKEELGKQTPTSALSMDAYLDTKVIGSIREHITKTEFASVQIEKQIESIQKLKIEAEKRVEDLKANLREKQAKETLSKEQMQLELKRRENLVSQKHRKLVKAVRHVTTLAWPRRHQDVCQILGVLLDKSFKPDAYHEVEDGWEEIVECLLRCELVSRHPHDPNRIRLVDFM